MTIALAILHLVFLTASPRSRPAQESDTVVVPVRVAGVSTSQPVATLEKKTRSPISPRDLLFIQTDGKHVRQGHVIVTSGQRAAGQLEGDVPITHPGTAVVLRIDGLASLCRFMPPEVTVIGKLARLPPGHATSWVDIGRFSGIQKGDSLLVRRETMSECRRIGLPIARGEVTVIDDSAALMTLQPLVGNTSPEMGDSVELWPAPGEARMGRVNSAVLKVAKGKEGDIITVVGALEDSFVEGRTLDLFRGSQFIGSAEVKEVGVPAPLSRAEMIKAASPQSPRVGDAAIRRAPAGPPAPPLRSPIFRIEGEYCLVAAGEVDGLQPGEKLVVSRQDPVTGQTSEAYELTADKVNMDYVGCYIRTIDPTAKPLKVWEWAERRSPRWPEWRQAGVVSDDVDVPARIVYGDIEIKSTIQAGDIIEIKPDGDQLPAAAIVLWRTTDRCVATIPVGWGDPAQMQRGQILIPSETARPGFTASAPASP